MFLEWGTPALLVTIGLTLGVVTDLSGRKIPNKLNFSLFVIALLSLFFISPIHSIWYQPLLSIGLALVLGLGLFALKVWGGGDAKLFLAVSPLLIVTDLPMFLLWSFVWGAALGLTLAILNGRLTQMFAIMSTAVLHRKGTDEKHLTKMPFSVALLFGHLSVVMLKARGLL